MTRAVLFAGLIGVMGSIAWLAMAAAGVVVMPSYLAAFLACLGIPLGALPLVLAADAWRLPPSPLLAVLRALTWLLPPAALFVIPLLLHQPYLFAHPGLGQPMPARWTGGAFHAARSVVALLVLSGIAVLAARPRPTGGRRRIALLGLILTLPLASLLAIDWVLALQPGLGSALIGPLVIAAQVGSALCVAVLLLAARASRAAALLLALAIAAWLSLQFVQFLVVWSANLPPEAAWYLVRFAGWGSIAAGIAAALALVAIVLLTGPAASRPPVIEAAAAALLLVHLVESFWLVTPGFRGRFVTNLADMAAIAGIGGLLAAGFLRGVHRVRI